jgi:hypothetical protein
MVVLLVVNFSRQSSTNGRLHLAFGQQRPTAGSGLSLGCRLGSKTNLNQPRWGASVDVVGAVHYVNLNWTDHRPERAEHGVVATHPVLHVHE